MFKKIATVFGVVLAALMAVGVGSATIAPSSDSTTTTTSSTALPDPGVAETIMYEVGDAGTVTIASDGAALSIVAVDAADGWAAEVEVASGREVEADFRNGMRRIQFNAELEDGEIRVRVRERADDGGGATTTSTTAAPVATPTTTSTTAPPSGDEDGATVTYQAGDAGTVMITQDGSSLTIVSVEPVAGWSTEIEVSSGREVEVDFRNGMRRIQFDAEFEDGEVRVRVSDRITDDGDHDDNADDDNSGHGNADDDDDDGDDDNSGPGNADDDDDDDN